MENIKVRITYKTSRYAAVDENTRAVLSCSIEQAVHDFVSSYLHNNPERKIEVLNAEIV